MKRLIALDLDGTLTQHRTPLGERNRQALDALAKKYRLVIVGAGETGRIIRQTGGYPIDIVGNYGLELAKYDPVSGTHIKVRSEQLECDEESVRSRVSELREKYGYTEFSGDGVEIHPSGAVTVPLLGTGASMRDKLIFDPDKEKRRAIYSDVCAAFPEYTVFIGGSSSFDMVKKPYDKYYALSEYCKEHEFLHSEAVFVGDDYLEGGGDASVYGTDFDFIEVNDYERFYDAIRHLL